MTRTYTAFTSTTLCRSAEGGQGGPLLHRVPNAGRVCAASELVGVGSAATGMTVDYLKQRKQFGRLIGEFQVLQHRAAHLYSELEIARAATLKAQQLLDEDADEADMMVSVAKAKAGSASALAVREGVQMHGGIGMTDEYDIGLYMKRYRWLSELFGDAADHADRVARLNDYWGASKARASGDPCPRIAVQRRTLAIAVLDETDLAFGFQDRPGDLVHVGDTRQAHLGFHFRAGHAVAAQIALQKLAVADDDAGRSFDIILEPGKQIARPGQKQAPEREGHDRQIGRAHV